MLADNEIASQAGWDRERLAIILPELTVLLEAEGADITVTGFDVAEIDQILVDFNDKDADVENDAICLESRPISQTGDIYILGSHRLFCGNARMKSNVALLMGGAFAVMSFNDPPYNLVVRKVIGRGRTKHREFA